MRRRANRDGRYGGTAREGVTAGHRPLVMVAVAVSLIAGLMVTTSPAQTARADVGDCESLAALELDEVIAIAAELDSDGEAAGQTDLPEFCRVSLTVDPAINVEVWLPTDTYNDRFQAVGGGVFAGVISFGAMANVLRNGYATASTDTGHSASPISGAWAFNPDGTFNLGLVEDFASRSLFELTEKSQTLIEEFYGTPEEYAYWNGCSTGGRQGLMLAQRLPDGYDGVLAGAPAINWDRFIPAELWPQIAMGEELGGPIAPCKLAEATNAAAAACDELDGVSDGVLADPTRCDFDPASLVGVETPCGVFTESDAVVIQSIWDGPRTVDGEFLWYGLAPGAPLNFLAGGFPFPIPVEHMKWVFEDPLFDWTTLDQSGFAEAFQSSQDRFNEVIGTDDPDLSGFRDAGGKVLIWHGWYDQLIFPEGTTDYYERVVDEFHSRTQVARFARLFMAPGVFHCGGGPGPNQFDMFGALVDWVENGNAPNRIIASGQIQGEPATRPLCLYPDVARYDRKGDPNEASSFACKPNFGPWGTPNQP